MNLKSLSQTEIAAEALRYLESLESKVISAARHQGFVGDDFEEALALLTNEHANAVVHAVRTLRIDAQELGFMMRRLEQAGIGRDEELAEVIDMAGKFKAMVIGATGLLKRFNELVDVIKPAQ